MEFEMQTKTVDCFWTCVLYP